MTLFKKKYKFRIKKKKRETSFPWIKTKQRNISGLLIYRTNSYKSLRSSIDKAAKKLETIKTETPNSSSSSSVAKVKISNKKSKTKKIDRVKTSLKESSRDLSLIKFKSGAVVALVLFIVFGLLNSLFEGKVVAKLPFKPFGIVMKKSHRGLHGDDVTNCLVPFLFQGEGRGTTPLNVLFCCCCFFFFFFFSDVSYFLLIPNLKIKKWCCFRSSNGNL